MRRYNPYGLMIQLDNLEFRIAHDMLIHGKMVETHWQAQTDVPQNNTVELLNVSFALRIPESLDVLRGDYKPTLPWADDHFEERVSRIPYNPPPSASHWRSSSATKAGVDATRNEAGEFSHTYPERFWPKEAGMFNPRLLGQEPIGIRYPYGDLDDVVSLLAREPYTRQAYLPVWFPEDTGAVHGERVPCTLGYHFVLRDGALHCFYPIRSCDFLRHFRNDLYLAARLTQWVLDEVKMRTARPDQLEFPWVDVKPGALNFHAVSLHVFDHPGDHLSIERILNP